ncbi:MAG TPA: D-alanine--D-alanine ligase [Candidatus Omnitrophota bacterium]|nr:D-alanine--D-alanine ligase [Candidatus Omnitrophota bacterium]HQJ15764.1 D-alanine--D-alanine ligase [Candidatus Omnitrophota bacterium]
MTYPIKSGFGKVGVLMGGPSEERQISLRSAAAVCESLKQQGLDVVPLDITTDDAVSNAALIRSSMIDCAFVVLHGRFGEDGTIQQILEDLQIPYTGSGVEASRRAMDKVVSQEMFLRAGLRVPEYVNVSRSAFERGAVVKVPFALPWVVKPSRQGSSIGLSIIDSPDGLGAAIRLALETDDTAVVQQYIRGRELTVAILEGKPLPVIEIVTTRRFFDYEAKYQNGFTKYIAPALLDATAASLVQEAAIAAHRALGCTGYSRVDIILGEDRVPYILELNNIPGLTQTSLLPKAARCAGIDFNQLCIRMLGSIYEKK